MSECPVCDRDLYTDASFHRLEELADHLAAAAPASAHASYAYSLLEENFPTIGTLKFRQTLIAGRMGRAA